MGDGLLGGRCSFWRLPCKEIVLANLNKELQPLRGAGIPGMNPGPGAAGEPFRECTDIWCDDGKARCQARAQGIAVGFGPLSWEPG